MQIAKYLVRTGPRPLRRTLLASALLGLAAQSFAVGLGEVAIDSALNERLRARIPLLDLGNLQTDDVRVALGSAEDFARLGVERFYFLQDLRFRVDAGPDGAAVRVSTDGPVTEPFLNFLVVLQWPQGRLLKEYTVLLDPPDFIDTAALAVAPAARAPAADGSGAPVMTTAVRGTQVDLVPRHAGGQLVGGVREGDQYRMGDGPETLWSIAERYGPGADDVTVQQTMLAIQRLNPAAFMGSNINRLKWGQTLTLPDAAEARRVDADTARAEVRAQSERWAQGLPEPALGTGAVDLPPQQTPSAIDATAAPAGGTEVGDDTGRLRIVTGVKPDDPAAAGSSGTPQEEEIEADGAADSGRPADVATPAAVVPSDLPEAEQLAALREENDRLDREVTELTGLLTRERASLAEQLAARDRQIELRDSEIAALQAEVERLAAGAPPGSDRGAPAAPDSGFWRSPFVLGGGAAIAVLLLALGLLGARRRRRDESAIPFSDLPPPIADRPPPPPRHAPIAETVEVAADSGEASAIATSAGSAPVSLDTIGAEGPIVPTVGASRGITPAAENRLAPVVTPAIIGGRLVDPTVTTAGGHVETITVAPTPAPPSVDDLLGDADPQVIGEADIYVAYGRFDQATEVLQRALAANPGQHGLRLKLLEVLAETGDAEQFEAVRERLVEAAAPAPVQAAAAQLARRFSGYDEMLPADAPANGGATAVRAPTAAKPGVGKASVEEVTAVAVPVAEPELALDIDLFDAEPTASVESANNPEPLAASGPELAIGTAGYRMEAEDIDQLDAETLAREMDGPVAARTNELSLDDFEFLDEGDSMATRLDLARAYIEMGDLEGAREMLREVIEEGDEAQRTAARTLLESL